MSTAPTIPMLNPDTGDVHAIPTDQVGAAQAAGGKPVATMQDPTGTMRYVPMDQVNDGIKAGGKLVPYGSPSSQESAQQITGIHPYTNPLAQGLAGVGRTIAGVATLPYQIGKAAFAPPTSDEETAAEGAAGPVGLAADRMIVQPARTAFQTAGKLNAQGHPLLAAGAALGALPGIGAWGQSLGNRAAAGDVTGAVTEGISGALMPKAIEKVAPLAAQVPGIKQIVQNRQAAQADNLPVPGENYTPVQHRAFSAVLARGTGMGKDFIAPDIASDIASPVRQAAADNPDLADVIQNGKPKDALGASQAILQNAKETIDQQHQMALQPVANTPIDMQPVLDAIPADQSFHTPAQKAQVQAFRDQAASVQTLGDLNSFRQYLGNENSPTFRGSAVAAGRSSVADKALQAADSAARSHYYDQLQQATGLDFQGLKRTESGIIKAQEAMQNVTPSLVNKDVLANEDKGLLGSAADVIDTGVRAGHGLPFVGYAAEKLRGSPLEQVQSGMQRFLGDLPQPSNYHGPLTSQWSPAPRSLAANVAGNAPYGANPSVGSTTPIQPATVTPQPNQTPLLPAQAGPSGILIPPGQPRAPYPPLNPATAQTRVYAGTPRPLQPAVPRRTINVSPEGQALIRRHALPPPARIKPAKKMDETKTFAQATVTALPSPIRRVLSSTGLNISLTPHMGGQNRPAIASVDAGSPNTINVEDPKRFNQSGPHKP